MLVFVTIQMKNEIFIVDNFIFNNSNEEKILGITIGNKLTFKSHIKVLCKKAPENRGFIKAIKLSLIIINNISFQFHNKIKV